VLAIVLVAIVAGLIAAVILLASDAGQSTEVGRYISDNVNDQVENIKTFLSDVVGT
jgi:hypothetical protein